jgi:hypothetical protein
MPPASHQVSATSLKLLIQQNHPHVPVGWESIVYVNKNKAAVYMARRIMLRAGATGDAGGSVGGKARSTEA